MIYTLSNMCAKNLCKRTLLVQLIIKNVVTCFFFGTQCICCHSPEGNTTVAFADSAFYTVGYMSLGGVCALSVCIFDLGPDFRKILRYS